MTRKDYVLIADAFKRALQKSEKEDINDGVLAEWYIQNQIEARKEGIKLAALILTGNLQFDNARFDSETFLKDCGINS